MGDTMNRCAIVLAAALLGTALVAGAPRQMAAPYGLFVHSDGELKSDYSDELKATVVQLALTPPGLAGTPSAASMVFRAQFAGRQPAAPPRSIRDPGPAGDHLRPECHPGRQAGVHDRPCRGAAAPAVVLREILGRARVHPARGEITRVVFSMSLAELGSLLQAERVTGTVMNSSFEFTNQHLAALRLFAMAIGVTEQAGKPPGR